MKNKEARLTTYFVVIFTILFLLALVFFWMMELRMKYSFLSHHRIKAVHQVETQAHILENRFRSIRSDFLFLSEFNAIMEESDLDQSLKRELMEKEFFLFIKNKKIYDHVRFLDLNGKEIVRVDDNDGFPEIVLPEDLKNCSTQYDFLETMKLARGQMYISPFDLKMEKNDSENFLKPVIRFGIPVWGGESEKEKKGVLLLNYLGRSLIADFKQATRTHPGVFSLLNDKGYWLYNDNDADEWGFMFDEKKDRTLAVKNFHLWQRIQQKIQDQVVMDNTLYTFRTVSLPDFPCAYPRKMTILNSISFDSTDLYIQKIPLETYLIICVAMAILAFFMAKLMVRRKLDQNTIQQMALYDSLTGLANRQLFKEKANQSIYQCRRYEFFYAVFFIDLDRFKKINDILGYKIGDEVLKKVAALLSKSLRNADIVARFGDDEFVLFLSRLRDKKDCITVAEKILFELSKGFVIDGNEVQVGASIGIVFSDSESEKTANIDDFIQLADLTMYEAKSKGENYFKVVEIQ